jgi:hypothetical protein
VNFVIGLVTLLQELTIKSIWEMPHIFYKARTNFSHSAVLIRKHQTISYVLWKKQRILWWML